MADAHWTGLERRRAPRTIAFLNTEFDRVDFDLTVRRLADTRSGAPFRYVVTPNVDHLIRLKREPSLLPLYDHAWLTVCDSRILELLARLSGLKLTVTPGSDLTQRLLEEVIDPNEPVTVIGGTPDVIDAVRARYGLRKLQWFDAPMGLRHDALARAACVEFVARNPSRFVFLCVGSPQQEMLAHEMAADPRCSGVGLCVGASLDFLAGKVKRAPRWMQRARLEWLHRLIGEPRRLWRRYLVDGPAIFVMWARWRLARGERAA